MKIAQLRRYKRTGLLILLLALAAMLYGRDVGASDGVEARAVNSAERFTNWQPWAQSSTKNHFNIDQCIGSGVYEGDVNGDGQTDLICIYRYPPTQSYPNGNWVVFVQLAVDNQYQPWQIWSNSFNGGFYNDAFIDSSCIKLGDFNGDNKTDIMCQIEDTRSQATDFIGWYSNESSEYNYWPRLTSYHSRFQPKQCHTITVADINNDNRDDLICPYIYPGSGGTVTFAAISQGETLKEWQAVSPTTPTSQVVLSGADNGCAYTRVADVDGNGDVDLICTYYYKYNSELRSVMLVQTNDGGTFSKWKRWSEPSEDAKFDWRRCHGDLASIITGTNNRHIFVGDVDGDGVDDQICVYGYPSDRYAIFVLTDSDSSPGNGYGNWENWGDFTVGFGISYCETIRAGDPNNDGLLDLICVYNSEEDGYSFTRVSSSSGSDFSGWKHWSKLTQSNIFDVTQCDSILVGDVNGDAHTDTICPYVYPDGSTKTFVQLAEVIEYKVFLPIVVR